MKHDWRLIVQQLKAKGYNAYKIGIALGVRHQSVKLWEGGSEPKHSIGEALLDLHTRICILGKKA